MRAKILQIKRAYAILFVMMIAVGSLGLWYFFGPSISLAEQEMAGQLLARFQPQLGSSPPASAENIGGSGVIEAQQVEIAAELAGRIANIPFHEGQPVQRGQVLVQLDTSLVDGQIHQAEAAVQAAEAQLARLRSGAIPEEIHQAEAGVTQALAAQASAKQVWQNAIAARDNPQQLEVQIAQVQADLAVAQQNLTQALANKDATEEQKKQADAFLQTIKPGVDIQIPLPDGSKVTKHVGPTSDQVRQAGTQFGLAVDQWWGAWASVELIQVQIEGLQHHLDNLMDMRDQPLTDQARVDAARIELEDATSMVEVARARLALVKAGPTPEQVRVAESAISRATAHLQSLQVQKQKMALEAPLPGVLTRQIAHAGETAIPGAALLQVSNLDPVTLMIYIPDTAVGKVQVGQQATVSVDAFPNQPFAGQVVFIDTQAQFSPKNVQTAQGRANLVFATKIRIPNPQGHLKPGMPADAKVEIEAISTITGTEQIGIREKLVQVSGSLEAECVAVSAEFGGIVEQISVAEGDLVVPGQILIAQDASLLQSRLAETQADLDGAQAQLEQVRAGPRPEEVAVAQAQYTQALARRDGAMRKWHTAQTLLANPQELNDQIDQARTAVALTQTAVEQAKAQLHAAQVKRDGYPQPSSDYETGQYQVIAAEAALAAAQARLTGTQALLAQILAIQINPIELRARVDQSHSAYQQAQAGVQAAQAALDHAQAAPRAEEIAVAEAGVRHAQAALGIIRLQLAKMTLRAPIEGLVASQAIEAGELAQPGATLITLANLDQISVRAFVPEAQIGRVHLGQSAQITVDSFPGRIFPGQVSFIAPETEFTPKNAQSNDKRANLVFAVKIALANPDYALKPGMPADVKIIE